MITDIKDSLISYWNEKGKIVLEQYKKEPNPPKPLRTIKSEELNNHISECESIILTANPLEDKIITNCLIKECGSFYKINSGDFTYDFFDWNDHKIAHLVPIRTSSFVDGGSADAVQYTLDHLNKKNKIKGIFGVGVAYGSDYIHQKFGDVLISEKIISWDTFWKIHNGTISFNPSDLHTIGMSIWAGVKRYFSIIDYPQKELERSYNWFFGTILEGAAVLSDERLKHSLMNAAKNIGIEKVMGGEMEGSGIRFSTRNSKIPLLIVKGICDWGAMKNAWDFVSEDPQEQEMIKDSIQAYACKNAFDTYLFILENVFGS